MVFLLVIDFGYCRIASTYGRREREREEVEVLLGVQFEVKASLGEDE